MSGAKVKIETSARHVHITREDLETLFGPGYRLTVKRELSQPGEFLSDEKVRVEGPRGGIDRVSILGPERSATQIEVSLTDARTLGADAPVRESGDVKGSAPCRLVGPVGSVDLSEGLIAAKRHVHLNPEDAEAAGVKDRDIVSVRTTGPRALTFGEVVIRIRADFLPAMHVDIDEANAAGLAPGAEGEIIVEA